MRDDKNTVLEVDGMTCGSCVRHVTSALDALGGVEHVQVELSDGTVLVRHDPSRTPIGELITALNDAGYPARESPSR